ncbi:MAG: hypothetical protein ACE10E_09270 [Acidiferrobacterales bacterium]|nr:hypothetical protein [Gammaproteobacteria bacterium]
MATIEFVIPADHPALAGHFPDNPIVPGVVLLDEIIRTTEVEVSSNSYRWQISDISVVKFLRPLLPGQLCTVELSRLNQGRIEFTCRSQGEVIAKGQLRGGRVSTREASR